MRQEERNRRSRENILTHAFAEFAEHGYSAASTNAICSSGNISKGILYHYYKGKDALYIACVQRCFQDLTEYLKAHLDPSRITPESYFDVRLEFFRQHPNHLKLFCAAVITKIPHLDKEIRACRAAFDEWNDACLAAILSQHRLAGGLTLQDAVDQLRLFEDFVHVSLAAAESPESRTNRHEEICRRALHVLLYGLIER